MSGSCILCGIKLISAAEIIRSSTGLHLEEKFVAIKPYFDKCYSCMQEDHLIFQCQSCKKNFCQECCSLIKDDIRFCIGCFEN